MKSSYRELSREEYKAPEFAKNRIEDNSIAPVNISLSQ